jgi:hypothetical protein
MARSGVVVAAGHIKHYAMVPGHDGGTLFTDQSGQLAAGTTDLDL